MNIETIESFIAVADEGSFTHGASSLYRDQSVVSRHIQSMEQELGVKLFNRSTRHVSLTPMGTELLPHMRATVAAYHDGTRMLDQKKREQENCLNIAYNYLSNDSLTTKWLIEFRDLHGVSLRISEADPSVIIDRVASGVIDGAFVGYIDEGTLPKHLGHLLIHSVGEYIIVGNCNPLSEAEALALDDLLDCEFVYPYKTPSENLSLVQHDLAKRGLSVTVSHTDFEGSALKAVEMGLSVTDRPTSVRLDSYDVHRIPYQCEEVIKYAFVWDPSRSSQKVEELVAFLRDKVADATSGKVE